VEKCIQCIEAACNLKFDEGLALEKTLFQECHANAQRAALIHMFFADKATSKLVDKSLRSAPVRQLVVLGESNKFDGLVEGFVGTPVLVKRLGAGNDARWMAELEGSEIILDSMAEGSPAQATLHWVLQSKPGICLGVASLRRADEQNWLKSFRAVGVRVLGELSSTPSVEIQPFERTVPEVLQTFTSVVKIAGFVPVVTRPSTSFVTDDIIVAFIEAAESLVVEGASFDRVDRVAERFGFIAGPFRRADIVGLRCGLQPASCKTLKSDRRRLDLRSQLLQRGRSGRASGAGYYDWAGSDPQISSVTAAVVQEVRGAAGSVAGEISDCEILGKLLHSVVRKCIQIHNEERVNTLSDLDVLCCAAIGFPRYLGGPMYWTSKAFDLSNEIDQAEFFAKISSEESLHEFIMRSATGLVS
jgi:3-hydroxyacyl-CoA dehydrogenase